MHLQRLLQINMATLAASGALLLGMGRRSPVLPLLVLLAAIASIWLTDITGWFRLNRAVGNLAALVAALISLRGVYLYGELDIFAIANFLVCAQVILLFEAKDDRVYWLLAGVSLFQVVAATGFSQGVWFALMAIVYMLLALSALALLLLHRQWHRYRPQRHPPIAPGHDRWPLAGQEPCFTATPASRAGAGVGREFFGRLGQIGLGTVAFTVLLFVTLPRLGGTAWRGTLAGPTHVVGFSDQVTLGELGETIESNDEVMRIFFFSDATGDPHPVTGEVYFYGAALAEYSNGQWKAEAPSSRTNSSRLAGTGSLPTDTPVWQECSIEPLDRDELFCVMPVVAAKPDKDVIVDHDRSRLLRAHYLRGERFSYRLVTTALGGGVQGPLVPNVEIASTNAAPPPDPPEAPKGLPRLTALADRWIAESGLPSDDRVGRARYLEQKFAASGQFEYSLQGQPRDTSLDPIEDFVSNNPRGHCEYFATALTLMLHSQRIPARMIVGYKCDEFNALGGFHQVRQSHAHTWVEVYLPGDELPEELLHGKDYWNWRTAGGWLRLDPTPAAGDVEATGTLASLVKRLQQTADWLDTLWSNYVIEMDRSRQHEAIYRPLVRAVRKAWRTLRDPGWRRAAGEKIRWALDLTQGGAGFWIRLGLLLPTGLLGLIFGVRAARRLLPRLWGWLGGRGAAAAAGCYPKIEFYRRFEALLARRGLVRPAGQTQQEFASWAGNRIAADTGRLQLATLPPRVVEAFYRVRFGRLPLDSRQSDAVEHALAELAAVERTAGRRPKTDVRDEP